LGHREAQYMLGQIYFAGEMIPKDMAEGAKWYLRAADQGHASAQYEIGNCYAFGEGVAENAYEAFFWYSLAASNGETDAEQARGLLSSMFTAQDIDNILQRAESWYSQHYSEQ
ncbi:MAG: sel1 repeat family protein, partial [Candidatus Cloacimonetes bacterium]|nr:sel1 repeat family protein [Candidatus Cloacimonadota bacterium]